MKYSKATNYALHTMVHLTMEPKGQTVSVDQLACMQDLSPTYLSKILTKLAKAGLIESVPGQKAATVFHAVRRTFRFWMLLKRWRVSRCFSTVRLTMKKAIV